MKTSLRFFPLFFLVVVAPGITRADTVPVSTPPSATSADAGTDAQKAERRERIKEAFSQLNLTDVQKEQIAQIRQNVTDRKERREQIRAVLTPDQQAKMKELRQQYQAGGANGA